jgi:hypothetical protein
MIVPDEAKQGFLLPEGLNDLREKRRQGVSRVAEATDEPPSGLN